MFPAWYFNTSKQWKDYLKELKPDVLILGAGLRDNSAFLAGSFWNFVDEVKTWDRPLDVLVCTPVSPSSDDGAYGTSTYQDGVDFVSGYPGSFCAPEEHRLL